MLCFIRALHITYYTTLVEIIETRHEGNAFYIVTRIQLCLTPWILCNTGYSSETHPKLKSREIWFGYNLSVTQLFRHFEQDT